MPDEGVNPAGRQDLAQRIADGAPKQSAPQILQAPLRVFALGLIENFNQRRGGVVEFIQLPGHDRPQDLRIDVAIFVS